MQHLLQSIDAAVTALEARALDDYMVRGWDRRGYRAKVGDALSQLLNALVGGAPDESLSGRAYRITVLEDSPPWRWRTVRRVADAIFFWQDEHCAWAFWEDVYRSRSRGKAAELFDRVVGLRTVDAQGTLPAATADNSKA